MIAGSPVRTDIAVRLSHTADEPQSEAARALKSVHYRAALIQGRPDMRKPRRLIYLDTYMPHRVYDGHGIRVRDHCRAEPPRNIDPARLIATVGWGHRASAPYAANVRVQASASAARGRLRGVHRRCAAPSLPPQARTTSGSGCLAGAVPAVLVRSCGCSRTIPGPHGSIPSNKKEAKEKTAQPGPRT